MTDQEYIKRQFEAECREKKRIARGEKNRVKSSRGAMKTVSDYLTAKEKKALNGEMVTIDMSKPVDWETFLTWSELSRKEYVENLRRTYNVPFSKLACMFQIKLAIFEKWRKQVGILGEKGYKEWDKKGWYEFCGGREELLNPVGYMFLKKGETQQTEKVEPQKSKSEERVEEKTKKEVDVKSGNDALTISMLMAMLKSAKGAKITIEIEV